eukprot:m.28235 g.28235  ORF g.28235 m.28235 type:complete len:200 (+) comp4910_c0_seq2:663-1262(+)
MPLSSADSQHRCPRAECIYHGGAVWLWSARHRLPFSRRESGGALRGLCKRWHAHCTRFSAQAASQIVQSINHSCRLLQRSLEALQARDDDAQTVYNEPDCTLPGVQFSRKLAQMGQGLSTGSLDTPPVSRKAQKKEKQRRVSLGEAEPDTDDLKSFGRQVLRMKKSSMHGTGPDGSDKSKRGGLRRKTSGILDPLLDED